MKGSGTNSDTCVGWPLEERNEFDYRSPWPVEAICMEYDFSEL